MQYLSRVRTIQVWWTVPGWDIINRDRWFIQNAIRWNFIKYDRFLLVKCLVRRWHFFQALESRSSRFCYPWDAQTKFAPLKILLAQHQPSFLIFTTLFVCFFCKIRALDHSDMSSSGSGSPKLKTNPWKKSAKFCCGIIIQGTCLLPPKAFSIPGWHLLKFSCS